MLTLFDGGPILPPGLSLISDWISVEEERDLSLMDTWVMEFSRMDQVLPVVAERRSLMVVTGEARDRWKHAVSHRKSDKLGAYAKPRTKRVSVTFRTIAK